jgi:peptidoglycan/xylan/chitin deacetylase (PgdA/CDA1 family)
MRLSFFFKKILKYLLIIPCFLFRSREKGIVILTYHRVLGLVDKEMDISVRAFERQMAYLAGNHKLVSLDDIRKCPSAEQIVADDGQDVVAVTFDDGYEDFYLNAFPILSRYAIPVTLYVATSFIETGGNFPFDEDLPPGLKERSKPLNWKQIREVVDSRLVTIGSHTHTHRYFNGMDPQEVERELCESKACIEKNLDRPAEHFCYPKNIHTEEAEKLVRKYYTTAVIGKRRKNTGSIDHFRLKRIPVQRSDDFCLFKANLKGYTCLGFLDLLSAVLKRKHIE